jgi:hypothetical protein
MDTGLTDRVRSQELGRGVCEATAILPIKFGGRFKPASGQPSNGGLGVTGSGAPATKSTPTGTQAESRLLSEGQWHTGCTCASSRGRCRLPAIYARVST